MTLPHETTAMDSRGAGSAPATGDVVTRSRGFDWVATAVVLVGYALLIALTRTLDQGDTSVYGDALVNWVRGRPVTLTPTGHPVWTMWEFGHPIWRPLAAAVLSVVHSDPARVTDGVLFEEAVRVLTWLSVLGGALAVGLFRAWVARVGVPRWTAVATTIAFAAASAFLGYAQTGSSYIPGVAMLLLGLWALAGDERESDRSAIAIASVGFALAVLLWVPLVLGVPAAALSAIILRGDTPRRRRVALAVCVVSALITIIVMMPIAALAGVRSISGFRTWIAESQHGISGIGGLQRAIVGLARSLVSMDRLGLVAKRYLIHDPFNPTTLGDVARAGLFRLVALYALLGAMAIALAVRPAGRRALGLLVATAIPVVGLALKWQGGDLERYLAMFPALFLGVAVLLSLLAPRARTAAAAAVALSVVALNVPAISRAKRDNECATLTARVRSVPREPAKPTLMFTPHELDEISTYRNRCPDAELLKDATAPRVLGFVMANYDLAAAWRSELARRADSVWAEGGHVWISRRAFVAAPPRSWKWAEGDDPRLHWKEFPEYFTQVDVGPPVGGEDGFVELLPTPRTRGAVERLRTVTSGAK
jgi:hypothetical protein